MATYISMLRGINVSGQKKVPMSTLKALCEGLGFADVETYIQSGNVVFTTNDQASIEGLRHLIEQAITNFFVFEVPVVLRSLAEMKEVVSCNPFAGFDKSLLYVTFLEAVPLDEELQSLSKYDYSPDKYAVFGREVYVLCPGGYGNTKLSNNFFERKLGLKATTRNWKTIEKLIEMAG